MHQWMSQPVRLARVTPTPTRQRVVSVATAKLVASVEAGDQATATMSNFEKVVVVAMVVVAMEMVAMEMEVVGQDRHRAAARYLQVAWVPLGVPRVMVHMRHS